MARRPTSATKRPTSKGFMAEGLDDVARRVSEVLHGEEAEFALIGGLAVLSSCNASLHG